MLRYRLPQPVEKRCNRIQNYTIAFAIIIGVVMHIQYQWVGVDKHSGWAGHPVNGHLSSRSAAERALYCLALSGLLLLVTYFRRLAKIAHRNLILGVFTELRLALSAER